MGAVVVLASLRPHLARRHPRSGFHAFARVWGRGIEAATLRHASVVPESCRQPRDRPPPASVKPRGFPDRWNV